MYYSFWGVIDCLVHVSYVSKLNFPQLLFLSLLEDGVLLLFLFCFVFLIEGFIPGDVTLGLSGGPKT